MAMGGWTRRRTGSWTAWRRRIGAWLIAQGIAAGDRVAILADNDARWIAAYLGALRIGAVAVPLDTAYKAGQVRTVLDNSGARLLFTTPRYLATAQAGVAQASPSPGIVLLHGEAPNVADARVFDESRRVPAIADVPAGAAAAILYTSGTTANPKGVVLTHDNLDAEREGAFGVVHVTEDDAILGVLPLFHALAQMANLLLPLSGRARSVPRDRQLDVAHHRARLARHHHLRVRAAVLLPDSPAGHVGSRPQRCDRKRVLRRALAPERLDPRPHGIESGPGPVRARASRARLRNAAVHHRRVEVRSGHRARSLRPWLHDPATGTASPRPRAPRRSCGPAIGSRVGRPAAPRYRCPHPRRMRPRRARPRSRRRRKTTAKC